MSPHLEYVLILIGCGLVVFGAGILAGCMVGPWRLIHWAHMARFDDYADRDYEEGFSDGRAVADDRSRHADVVDRQAPQAALLAVPDVPAPSPALRLRSGESEADLHRPNLGDWRAEMTEQLAPAALDAANLPGAGPEGYVSATQQRMSGERNLAARAGELHLRRIVEVGHKGDDKMLSRDWFARRDFVYKELAAPPVGWTGPWLYGGYEITDRGHLVAVAA